MGGETLVASVMKQNTAGGRYTPSRCVCVAARGTPLSHPHIMSICEGNTMREGFPPLVVSVWKETQQRRGKPLSLHLYVKETRQERVSPLSPCLCGSKHSEKG